MEICAQYLRYSVEFLHLQSQYSCLLKHLLACYSNYTFISQICFQLRKKNRLCLGASAYFKQQGDSWECTDEQLPPLNHALYVTAPMNNVYASQHYKIKWCYIIICSRWPKDIGILDRRGKTQHNPHSAHHQQVSTARGESHLRFCSEEVRASASSWTLPFITTEKKQAISGCDFYGQFNVFFMMTWCNESCLFTLKMCFERRLWGKGLPFFPRPFFPLNCLLSFLSSPTSGKYFGTSGLGFDSLQQEGSAL